MDRMSDLTETFERVEKLDKCLYDEYLSRVYVVLAEAAESLRNSLHVRGRTLSPYKRVNSLILRKQS